MVDVERADAVAEAPKRMPEACRVQATGDEADNVPARRNEVVPADVLFDPCAKRSSVHEPILRRNRPAQSSGPTSPFLVESRLSLGEHVVGEVREPVRAVHALARVAAFGLNRDGGAVLWNIASR